MAAADVAMAAGYAVCGCGERFPLTHLKLAMVHHMLCDQGGPVE